MPFAIIYDFFFSYDNFPFTDAGWIILVFALAQVPLWTIRELFRSPEIGIVQVN